MNNGYLDKNLLLTQNLYMKELLFTEALIHYYWQLTNSGQDLVQTILNHQTIFKYLIEYFKTKFDPQIENRDKKLIAYDNLINQLLNDLDNINDDKIFRLFYLILKNTVRTNYFLEKETISFKFHVDGYKSFLEGTQPSYEIFVYNHILSGVHLRMTKISRGGLRWSDRHEDFRNEIKSLMTTQQRKNSIIVPSGAKGGFIIKKDNITKDEFQYYYKLFVDSLLELVDHNSDKQKIENTDILSYDDYDNYFVVAADKGTSAMSDIANSIAIQKKFWLGDAFASGGSNGFNHKELGITAKGAMKSVERFFIEKDLDFYNNRVNIIGIGSMSGDVFGNGIIESPSFALLGAISSKEIFIDPNPNLEIAYKERVRLFHDKHSSWSNYNKKLISKGGGVFKRDAIKIVLTKEIQELLQTTQEIMSGDELGSHLLKVKVDILFNGGVGTYFKSSDEENTNIGDISNQAIRVNASEIKAYSVCEGGNLGFTQNARIEYAKAGGKINMDSIDNSAGVDTSDHEVNIKIIMAELIKNKILTNDNRTDMLKDLTSDIVYDVLLTNYYQSLSISLDEQRSKTNLDSFLTTIHILDTYIPSFTRVLLSIPKNSDFEIILTKDRTIVRPILSTLLSYSKIFMTDILLGSTLIEELYYEKYLFKYFPKKFSRLYSTQILNHPLKKEIISTMIANYIINNAGATFIDDYELLGNKKFLLKIRSYITIDDLLNINHIRASIYDLDYKMDYIKQYKALLNIEQSIQNKIFD